MEEKTKTLKTLTGTVVSEKMKDTVTVAVSRYVKHPKYKKYVMKTKKYLAHDPGNTKTVGERVTIQACRPISKRKRFLVVQ
ncbi:MAG: 30S ribosomal protein S17 [bacterium]|nr:30S ribosomal protein S17 [bacterium]